MKSKPSSILAALSIVASTLSLQAGKPSSDHTFAQTGPIELGTSGGWEYDLANGYCCGGTLGSLIRTKSDNALHILSNFHVLSADIVSGGNQEVAKFGQPVIHPALIDVSCNANNTNVLQVAWLSDWSDPLNTPQGTPVVDAAIAEVIDSNMVDTSGSILGIGEIANVTLPAIESLGAPVKKSGRTTGLTSSSVVLINATVNVAYEDECAGSTRGTATFTNQIVIDNKGSKFLAGGDSGSLLVENKNKAPKAVGLLFAGSSSHAIANPIDDVLSTFNAEMVGISPSTNDGGDGSTTDGGTSNGNGNRGKKPKSDKAQIALAQAANKKAAAFISRVPQGVGHGIGLDSSGKPYIAILVESTSDAAAAAIPPAIDGFSVRLVATGKIVAL